MSSFDEREKGFEKKFATEQEQEFMAHARRNRLLGEWAAKRLGLENVDDYAKAIVRSNVDQADDESVFRKIIQDFTGSGIEFRETEVRAKMDELLAIAREEIRAGE